MESTCADSSDDAHTLIGFVHGAQFILLGIAIATGYVDVSNYRWVVRHHAASTSIKSSCIAGMVHAVLTLPCHQVLWQIDWLTFSLLWQVWQALTNSQ
jgi:hypothetical protein